MHRALARLEIVQVAGDRVIAGRDIGEPDEMVSINI